MNRKLISKKQYTAAMFVAILSPLLRSLPKNIVVLADKGAWLSVLPALPVLLLLAAVMGSLHRQMEPGEGLADLFLRFMGPFFGRIMLIFFAGWLLFYGGFILRSGAARLVATVYLQSSQGLFIVAMLAVCLIVSLGTVRAIARTSVLLVGALLAALAVIILATMSDISAENLFPLTTADVPGILMGAQPVVTIGAVAAYFSFLNGYAQPLEKPIRRLLPMLFLYLGLVLVLCVEVIGIFGAGLTKKLSYPFFIMVRDITILNAAPRVDAVVIVMWGLADFILCSLLLRCSHEAVRGIFSLPFPENVPALTLRKGRWLIWLEAFVMLGCAFLISDNASVLSAMSGGFISLSTDAVVYFSFLLLWVVGKIRKKLRSSP